MSSSDRRSIVPFLLRTLGPLGLAVLASGCYIAVDKSDDGDQGACVECVSPRFDGGSSATGGYAEPGPGNEPGTEPQTGSGGSAGPSTPRGTGGGASAGAGSGAGGGAAGSYGPTAPLPSSMPVTCPAVKVARFNELLIVDPAVTSHPRASNQSSDRPWSFRQRIETLVGGSTDAAGALADAWLAQWSTLTDVPISVAPGAPRVALEPRPAAQSVLRCPWERLTSSNGCDSTCGSCSARRVDLSQAPFRLLGIANRIDLAGNGSSAACTTKGGELRFVYGAADPFTLRALPFTVIFEYDINLGKTETLRDWAAAWHELGAFGQGSRAFVDGVAAVVAKGLARASLRRVLTNEIAFGSADGLPWEMRQFVPTLTDAGTTRLVEVAVSGTPRLTVGSSPELGQWIDDNAAAVIAGDYTLPPSYLAASAPLPAAGFTWTTTAHDTTAAAAFNRNTCNGCHGGRTDSTDLPFQHIAPPTDIYYGTGGLSTMPRLSKFLHDPGHDDELGRREQQMAALLCTPCPAP